MIDDQRSTGNEGEDKSMVFSERTCDCEGCCDKTAKIARPSVDLTLDNLSVEDEVYVHIQPNNTTPIYLNKIEDWRIHETPKRNSENDDVYQPSHYARYRVEPITFIMVNDLPYHVGNIIKYICRAGYKLYPGLDAKQSEIKDLEKIRRYAEMRINQLEGKGIL